MSASTSMISLISLFAARSVRSSCDFMAGTYPYAAGECQSIRVADESFMFTCEGNASYPMGGMLTRYYGTDSCDEDSASSMTMEDVDSSLYSCFTEMDCDRYDFEIGQFDANSVCGGVPSELEVYVIVAGVQDCVLAEMDDDGERVYVMATLDSSGYYVKEFGMEDSGCSMNSTYDSYNITSGCFTHYSGSMSTEYSFMKEGDPANRVLMGSVAAALSVLVSLFAW